MLISRGLENSVKYDKRGGLGINVGERFFVYFNPNATGVGGAGVEIFSKKNYRGGGGGAFIRDLRVQA